MEWSGFNPIQLIPCVRCALGGGKARQRPFAENADFRGGSMMRVNHWLGHLSRWVIRRCVRLYYPSIEISHGERIPQEGPVLLAANHPNSLMDPVVVGITAKRAVRFLAKAPLFDVPVLGRMMKALGMVPAYRGCDDPTQVRRNVESLEAGANILAANEVLGIFPEGKTHDEPGVERVRSGVARIAMQAAEAGTPVKIVPLALNYEDKTRFRSSVWVCVGEPIDAKEWLAKHGNDARHAMRELTRELDRRLKDLAVHLEEPEWQAIKEDLEQLAPAPVEVLAWPAGTVRQRKRVADAMNFFLAANRARAETIGARIVRHRERAAAVGLRLDSPILNMQGLRLFGRMLWKPFWILFWLPVALLGTLHHLVPFLAVRAVAPRMQTPGQTSVSLARLGLGLPVYAAWYAFMIWWWVHRWYYTVEWVVFYNVAMPFAGLLTMEYWPRAREAAGLWWRQIRLLSRGQALTELRRDHQALRTELLHLEEEYVRSCPLARPEAPSRLPSRWPRRLAWSAVAVAVLLLGWGYHTSREKPVTELATPGPDLAQRPAPTLSRQLDADEAALDAILADLKELEAHANRMHLEFRQGQRNYYSQEDNDVVRQLMLSYLNYRAALLRLIWKYQKCEEIGDEKLRLRAFLCGYAAAASLYQASLRFVMGFEREEAIRKLNEGDTAWGVPAGLYDTIRGNLRRTEFRSFLKQARDRYSRCESGFRDHGLLDAEPYVRFHAALSGIESATAQLEEKLWTDRLVQTYQGAKRTGTGIKYELQALVATWIGDVKMREPHRGRLPIPEDQLTEVRSKLSAGDILLERHNWFLSNAFLPGYWPHAAMYVGTVEELRALGLDQDERVKRHLPKFARSDEEGHPRVIVEALSEGVAMTSLPRSVGECDAVAVLRPRLPPERIREAIARTFSHAEKAYDFEFDFFTTDKIVCTELVFRAYDGAVDFKLINVMGRMTLPAIEIVKKYRDEQGTQGQQLDLIAWVRVNEKTGAVEFPDEEAFIRTLELPGLDYLQGLPKLK